MIDVKRAIRLNRGSSSGQVAFWDDTLKKWTPAETSELFWDDTNKRLSVNDSSPDAKFTVGGDVEILNGLGENLCPSLTPTDWTVGLGWATPNGILNKNTAGTGDATLTTFAPEVGKTYKITVIVDTKTGSNFFARLCGTTIYTDIISGLSGIAAAGTHIFYVTATNTTGFAFRPATLTRTTISSVCIQEVYNSDIKSGGKLEIVNTPYTGDVMEGAGTRGTLLYYPLKNAFRCGVFGTEGDDASIGLDSVAMGYRTEATKTKSNAIGSQCGCETANSFSFGISSNISDGAGSNIFNMGATCNVSAYVTSSFNMGIGCTISVDDADQRTSILSIGISNYVYDSERCVAIGYQAYIQLCNYAFSIGIDTTAGPIFGTIAENVAIIGISVDNPYSNTLGIGVDVNSVTRIPQIWITDETDGGYVGIGVADPTTISAKLQVTGGASGKTSIFRNNITSPGNLTEWQNSSGNTLAYVNNLGTSKFVEINATGNITLDGTGNAFMILDRNATTNFAAFQFKTNGATKATVGIYNTATNYLVFNLDSADAGRRQSLILKPNLEAVFNEEGGDMNFRVEGDTDENLFFIDAGTDNIGVGEGSPSEKLEVKGNLFLNTDSNKVILGAGKDMSIYYDGTNGNIDTDVVAPSDLYIDCGTDKTVVLEETVWQDINLGAAMLTLPASSQPDEVQFVDEAGASTGIYSWGFATGEKVSGNFEIQHDYKEGTDLHFHVHFQGITAPTGTDNIKWQLTYTVSRDNATLDAVTIITKQCPYDTQYEFTRCDFDAITGTNFKIGDQFLFTLERIAASADEYAGDAIVATIGVHYQIDTIGSRQIGTK